MKKSIASLVLVVTSTPVLCADATAPVVDRLVACVDVQDTRQRLACFDREIAPLARSRTAVTPAPAQSVPPVVRTAPTPTAPAPAPAPAPASAQFGQEQLSLKDKPPATAGEQLLHARIASIRPTGNGAWLVSLDNGQGWRHEDQHLGSYLREGEAVTIEKATLGSYRLTRDAGGAKNWIRVKRVR